MLLYIHVPFCRSKCYYCSFYSVPFDEDLVDAYIKALTKEIRYRAQNFATKKINTIYFGGGTPSLLKLNQIEIILNEISKNFSLNSALEFSFEGNPSSLKDLIFLKGLKSLGVNRISIGVQSLRDSYLKFLGRIHTVKDAIFSIKLSKLAGFDNINIDLIWGLPNQTPISWLEDLKQVTQFEITHVSCYELTIEENTPMYQMLKDKKFKLPDEKKLSAIYLYGADYLESQGLLQYEISNFAKLGYCCLHNLGYWEQMDYLGLGPSAVSTIGNLRWKNTHDIKMYCKNPLTCNKTTLSKQDKLKEFVMLRLRTCRGLNLKEYSKISGENFWQKNYSYINLLHKKNLIRIRNGYLSLTKRGFLVSNAIIERLFP